MIAELYILEESFALNKELSALEIEEKTKRLAEDFKIITKHGEDNKLFVDFSVLKGVQFYSNYTIGDFLFNPMEMKKFIDRDVVNSIQTIFQKAQHTNISSTEVINVLLPWHDKDRCHGLIAFKKLNGIDENVQVIYGIDGFFKFRRYFLGMYPNVEVFLKECTKYFPNLFFHERNQDTIKSILDGCSNKIVYHLSALNDRFQESRLPNLNRTQVLEHFSINSKLDETASLEGNAERKADLTFSFKDKQGKEHKVCCEPHLKLCYNDINKSYSNDRRIYFHEGVNEIQNGKILIGHIGKHL